MASVAPFTHKDITTEKNSFSLSLDKQRRAITLEEKEEEEEELEEEETASPASSIIKQKTTRMVTRYRPHALGGVAL